MAKEENGGNLSMFEDLMSDEGAVHQNDPFETYGEYANYENFDDFQNNSNATRTVKDDGGYKTIDTSILDDNGGSNLTDGTTNQDLDNDLIIEVLKNKGIDPNSIKCENENGEIEELKFSELSKEEQLSLLSDIETESNDEYSETELEAIEFLRENNMSISELAQAIRQKTIDELKTEEQTYSVDEFTDDELFIADFRNKYGEDFTEDELLAELEKAKENEDLFNKKMTKLRTDYKSYEDAEKEEKTARAKAEQDRIYNEYVSNMVNVAKNINDLHDTAELEETDKSEILDFIFNEDGNGKTALQKAFDDPETLFKVAWYIKHGDEVFKEIHQYYQGEISKLSKNTKTKPVETVVKPSKNQHTTRQRPKRLEDLY